MGVSKVLIVCNEMSQLGDISTLLDARISQLKSKGIEVSIFHRAEGNNLGAVITMAVLEIKRGSSSTSDLLVLDEGEDADIEGEGVLYHLNQDFVQIKARLEALPQVTLDEIRATSPARRGSSSPFAAAAASTGAPKEGQVTDPLLVKSEDAEDKKKSKWSSCCPC